MSEDEIAASVRDARAHPPVLRGHQAPVAHFVKRGAAAGNQYWCGTGLSCAYDRQFSHWMPLPEAPQ